MLQNVQVNGSETWAMEKMVSLLPEGTGRVLFASPLDDDCAEDEALVLGNSMKRLPLVTLVVMASHLRILHIHLSPPLAKVKVARTGGLGLGEDGQLASGSNRASPSAC